MNKWSSPTKETRTWAVNVEVILSFHQIIKMLCLAMFRWQTLQNFLHWEVWAQRTLFQCTFANFFQFKYPLKCLETQFLGRPSKRHSFFFLKKEVHVLLSYIATENKWAFYSSSRWYRYLDVTGAWGVGTHSKKEKRNELDDVVSLTTPFIFLPSFHMRNRIEYSPSNFIKKR